MLSKFLLQSMFLLGRFPIFLPQRHAVCQGLTGSERKSPTQGHLAEVLSMPNYTEYQLALKNRHYKYDWLLRNTNTFLLCSNYDSSTKRLIFYATLKAVIYRLSEYYSDANIHANIAILAHFCC